MAATLIHRRPRTLQLHIKDYIASWPNHRKSEADRANDVQIPQPNLRIKAPSKTTAEMGPGPSANQQQVPTDYKISPKKKHAIVSAENGDTIVSRQTSAKKIIMAALIYRKHAALGRSRPVTTVPIKAASYTSQSPLRSSSSGASAKRSSRNQVEKCRSKPDCMT